MIRRILNFGITCSTKLDVRSPAVLRFAEDIAVRVPELSQVSQGEDVFELFQTKGRSRVRHVRIKSTGVQFAAGDELSSQDQANFIRACAEAVEKLEISKLSLALVDLRHIFPVRHWGNQHFLVAQAFYSSSPLRSFQEAVTSSLTRNEIAFVLDLSGNDLIVAIEISPSTSRNEILSGDYDGDNVDVKCGIARVAGFASMSTFAALFEELEDAWSSQLEGALVQYIVQPLQQLAISEKPPI